MRVCGGGGGRVTQQSWLMLLIYVSWYAGAQAVFSTGIKLRVNSHAVLLFGFGHNAETSSIALET